jgi:hypothetical protein
MLKIRAVTGITSVLPIRTRKNTYPSDMKFLLYPNQKKRLDTQTLNLKQQFPFGRVGTGILSGSDRQH